MFRKACVRLEPAVVHVLCAAYRLHNCRLIMRTLCPLLCQVTAQGFILTCSSSINGEGVELELGKPNGRFLLQELRSKDFVCS
jgi:hypothetical protein